MTTVPVSKCPQCGDTRVEFPAFLEAQPDDRITCPGCGHWAAKRDFTVEVIQQVADIAKDALRNVPGFKAK